VVELRGKERRLPVEKKGFSLLRFFTREIFFRKNPYIARGIVRRKKGSLSTKENRVSESSVRTKGKEGTESFDPHSNQKPPSNLGLSDPRGGGMNSSNTKKATSKQGNFLVKTPFGKKGAEKTQLDRKFSSREGL